MPSIASIAFLSLPHIKLAIYVKSRMHETIHPKYLAKDPPELAWYSSKATVAFRACRGYPPVVKTFRSFTVDEITPEKNYPYFCRLI
jgi:hypothetical protein